MRCRHEYSFAIDEEVPWVFWCASCHREFRQGDDDTTLGDIPLIALFFLTLALSIYDFWIGW